MKLFVEKMENDESDIIFDSYYQNSILAKNLGICDITCKKFHMCSIKFPKSKEYF